jgi:hypothetical protein
VSKFTDQENWYKPFGAGYVTAAVLEWEIGRVGSGFWLRIPCGFPFNVSVPRYLEWAFSPHEPRYHKAAALHDYALANGFNRIAAASLFNDGLMACGVGRLERLAMVLAVILYKWW